MSATAVAPAAEAVMAQARYENFPVASLLLPRREREQLLAIYGVARLIDDAGDEAPGDRTELLHELGRQLDCVYAGGEPEHPAMRALAAARRVRELPEAPFRALLQANIQDQTVSRYESFDQLLAYCRLSAAPVGELVLHAFDAVSPERLTLSERICAGLQVAEHLQDVREDYTRGRVYLPREDMNRFECEEAELGSRSASPALRALIAFEVGRARKLLADGAPLARTLARRPRVAVAGFIAGGRAALSAIERCGYDVCAQTPRPTRRGLLRAFPGALGGR